MTFEKWPLKNIWHELWEISDMNFGKYLTWTLENIWHDLWKISDINIWKYLTWTLGNIWRGKTVKFLDFFISKKTYVLPMVSLCRHWQEVNLMFVTLQFGEKGNTSNTGIKWSDSQQLGDRTTNYVLCGCCNSDSEWCFHSSQPSVRVLTFVTCDCSKLDGSVVYDG